MTETLSRPKRPAVRPEASDAPTCPLDPFPGYSGPALPALPTTNPLFATGDLDRRGFDDVIAGAPGSVLAFAVLTAPRPRVWVG